MRGRDNKGGTGERKEPRRKRDKDEFRMDGGGLRKDKRKCIMSEL